MKRFNKKLATRISALFLAITLSIAFPCEINFSAGVAGSGISISIDKLATDSFAAGSQTITVKKSDNKTAQAIHNVLKDGKSLTLAVKGDSIKSQSLLKSINNRIKKVNKQGVVFRYSYVNTVGEYSYYQVNEDQAGTYQYAVKFVDKLYKYCRKLYTSNTDFKNYLYDVKKFPDKKERTWRWAYVYVANRFYRNYWSSDDSYLDGVTKIETKSTPYLTDYSVTNDLTRDDFMLKEEVEIKIIPTDYILKYPKDYKLHSDDLYGYVFNSGSYVFSTDEDAKETGLIPDWYYDWYLSRCNDATEEELEEYIFVKKYTFDDGKDRSEQVKAIEDLGITVEVISREEDAKVYTETTSRPYTLAEFKKLPVAKKIYKVVRESNYPITGSSMIQDCNADVLIYNTKNFCDLSDAMKIYAIDRTRYFSSFNSEYGMKYEYIYTNYYGKEGMKTLYKGKAVGVCMIFARYENQLWDALDIEHYYNSAWEINHAWSVVKVKNTKGKYLWIPFDYGMEPSFALAINDDQKKYVNTEAKRYKLYLRNIPGAPTKKNFKNSDFN